MFLINFRSIWFELLALPTLTVQTAADTHTLALTENLLIYFQGDVQYVIRMNR